MVATSSPPLDAASEEGWGRLDAPSDEGYDEFDAWATSEKLERAKATYAPEHAPERHHEEWTITTEGAVHDHFFSNRAASFDALPGASQRLADNCAALGFTRPSRAQADAFGPIVEGDDCVLAHPTGAGKSLAYVAPLVQRLWDLEAEHGRTPKRQVRAIVIVPTEELGAQVLHLARTVAKRSIVATLATGGHNWQTQRRKLKGGVDLLVCTMGRLVAHLSPRGGEPSFFLHGTRLVVADEADSLYQGEAPSYLNRQFRNSMGDEGHHDEEGEYHNARLERQEPPLAKWKWLLGELPAACGRSLVTASLPTSMEGEVVKDLPYHTRIVGAGLHQTRPGVELRLVDCTVPVYTEGQPFYFESKLDELIASLKDAPVARALVLCSSSATVERVARELDEALKDPNRAKSAQVLSFHGSLPADKRSVALELFRRPPASTGATGEHNNAPPPRVLVATGRAVRGLELAQDETPLEHVVLFEFPPDAKAYIARVGCASRGSRRPARVTALAVGKQLPFARAMLAHDEAGEQAFVD